MDQVFESVAEVFKVIGLPPELFGVAIAVGIMLRLARGMVPSFGPSKTYYAAVAIGVIAGAWRAWRVSVDGAPTAALAVMASTLLVQFALQKLAGRVKWLPTDNEWVENPDGPPPVIIPGGTDAKPENHDSRGGADAGGGRVN